MGEGMVVDGGGRWSKREGGREKGGKNAYVPSLRWTRQFTHVNLPTSRNADRFDRGNTDSCIRLYIFQF